MERPLLSEEQSKLLDKLQAELQEWKIPAPNKTRKKKSTGYGRSVAFGFIRKRAYEPAPSRYNARKPRIWELLKQYGKTIGIPYTAIQVNQDVVCDKHKDKGNKGLSYLVSFGDYKKGELVVEDKEYDCNRKPLIFDGCKQEHWNNEFEGSKWTIVFFTIEIPKRFQHKYPEGWESTIVEMFEPSVNNSHS